MTNCTAKRYSVELKSCPHNPDTSGITSYDTWESHVRECVLTDDGEWWIIESIEADECQGISVHTSAHSTRFGFATWTDKMHGAVPHEDVEEEQPQEEKKKEPLEELLEEGLEIARTYAWKALDVLLDSFPKTEYEECECGRAKPCRHC